ncbi:MAG TPA: SRPBCC family protein [Solirubrobacteraceae bacterium]|nr:SRPBCC family protein [Solirubrobacteraceae bacterium]
MTVLKGTSQAEIAAGIDHCWRVLEDVASAPRWQSGLERVEVVARDAAGRVSECDAVIDARFTTVRCRLSVSYDPPHRLELARLQSEDLDELRATWELQSLPGGMTLATWSVEVDPGPLGPLARPLERVLRPLFVGARARELARAVQRAPSC